MFHFFYLLTFKLKVLLIIQNLNTMLFHYRKQIVQWVIDLAPSIVAAIYPPRVWEFTLEDYRLLPKGTLGRDIADFLDERALGFLAHGEQHDVRHILLGYDMTTFDELRMQAFMVGNNLRWHLVGWLILLFGGCLLPEWWTQLRQDFKRGQQAKDISKIQWLKLLRLPTSSLQSYFKIPVRAISTAQKQFKTSGS